MNKLTLILGILPTENKVSQSIIVDKRKQNNLGNVPKINVAKPKELNEEGKSSGKNESVLSFGAGATKVQQSKLILDTIEFI